MIDLRSDTVTKPSKEMLQKVLEAELGDDEYKEDPTVNSLEEYCSGLMGFESGLFVTSGLMGNQISLLIHSNPGEEVITTKDSHIKNYEHGAAAFLSRTQ
jgi:threonine aldolase